MAGNERTRERSLGRNLFLAIVTAAVVLVAGWLAWRNQVRQEALRSARAAAERGAYPEALQALRPHFEPDAAATDPFRLAYAAALREQAASLLRQNQLVAARAAVTAALATAARGSESWLAAEKLQREIELADAAQLVAEGKIPEAVARYVKLAEFQLAVETLAAARAFAPAADLAEKHLRDKDWSRRLRVMAAAAAAAAKDWPRAAELYQKVESWPEAVEAHLLAGQNQEAFQVAVVRIKDNPGLLARAYAAVGQWQTGAKMLLNIDDIDGAVRILVAAEEWQQAAKFLGDKNRFADAAGILEQGRLWNDAAYMWLKIPDNDRALNAYLEGRQWNQAERLLVQLGRPTEAAEVLERGELWLDAARRWQMIGLPARAVQAYRRVLLPILANKDLDAATRIMVGVVDPEVRKALAQACRSAFNPVTQPFELAVFLCASDEWAEAAALYEQAGTLRAAGEAWARAGEWGPAARVLQQAARAEKDVGLMLRAAEACESAGDQPARAGMFELALAESIARGLPRTVAEIYRKKNKNIEGAEALLGLAEGWVDARDRAALEAVQEASTLLPQTTFAPAIKELYKRCEIVANRVAERMQSYPKLVEGGINMTNYYAANRRFERSGGTVGISNTSKRDIKRVVMVVELIEKASEIYLGVEGPDPGVARAAAEIFANISLKLKPREPAAPGNGFEGWVWRDRASTEKFSQSQPEFTQLHVLEDIPIGESKQIEVKLTNAVPYKWVRISFKDLEQVAAR